MIYYSCDFIGSQAVILQYVFFRDCHRLTDRYMVKCFFEMRASLGAYTCVYCVSN